MDSEYLHDQGKRTHLLDYLAALHETSGDLGILLLHLEHEYLIDEQRAEIAQKACGAAMNLLADMRMVQPMLLDIYRDYDAVVPE